MTRRYDIDWLRVIAIGLLLIYHIAITFQPWGVFIGFMVNDQFLENLWIPMSLINVWRIPLLFFVSGMGVYFAIQKRNWKQLMTERSKRILLPLVFGSVAIVPLHIMVFQDYYKADLSFIPDPGHLWFLGNIFCYVLILTPLFFLLKKYNNGTFRQWLDWVFSNPATLMIIVLPFAAEAYIMNPNIFEMYYMNWHGFTLGLLAFFFGFLFVYSGNRFWQTASKWRWMYLGMAFSLYLIRLLIFDMKSPNIMLSVESNLWILAVLGLGHTYLNRPSKTLSYLSQAVYPVYIIHMVALYLASYWILPMDIPAIGKFIAIAALTFLGCFAMYDLVIRRTKWLRPLFGLKMSPGKQAEKSKALKLQAIPSSK